MNPDKIPDQFIQSMVAAGEVHSRPVNTSLIQVYAHLLGDLDLVHCASAILELLRHSNYFPKPVDIRNTIEGNPNDLALSAWHGIRRWLADPNDQPDALCMDIIDSFGGYRSMQLASPYSFENTLRSDFIAAYKSNIMQNRKMLAEFDRLNEKLGFLNNDKTK